MKERSIKGVLISIALIEGLGYISSKLAGDSAAVYAELVKPPLSPPGWVFGVAWGILYALMGIAAYLIYTAKAGAQERRDALGLFGWQLAVNLLWPVFFFRWELLWAAILVIVILDVLVVFTIRRFKAIDRLAGNLLIPYLLWILFATYLNVGFAFLN